MAQYKYDYDIYLQSFADAFFDSVYFSTGSIFSTLDMIDMTADDHVFVCGAVYIRLHNYFYTQDYIIDPVDDVILKYYKRFVDFYFKKLGYNVPCFKSLRSLVLRLVSKKYWARKVRVFVYRRDEYKCLSKTVGRGKYQNSYVSYYTYRKWSKNRQDAIDKMSRMYAVSDSGDVVGMDKIIESSESNPSVRHALLMARIKGLESIAIENDHVSYFVTITCPSRYHPSSDKWDGSSPRDAQDYLTKLWSQIRSALQRAGVHLYGLRISEAHKDGCPHWHMLLFFDPKFLLTDSNNLSVFDILKSYALSDSPFELGAMDWFDISKNEFKSGKRFDFKEILLNQTDADGNHKSAVCYVIKYISKNTGYVSDKNNLTAKDQDLKDVQSSVVCWASIWSIRQFQFIGTPPKSVWVESRRLGEGDENKQDNPLIEFIRVASTAGDYAAFINAMGGIGVCAKRSTIPVKTYSISTDKYGDPLYNEYEEPVTKLKGLSVKPVILNNLVVSPEILVVTRLKTWQIQKSDLLDCFEISDEYGFYPSQNYDLDDGFLPVSWIHNNNCISSDILFNEYIINNKTLIEYPKYNDFINIDYDLFGISTLPIKLLTKNPVNLPIQKIV